MRNSGGSRHKAGVEVHLVARGSGDNKVGVLGAGFGKHLVGGAVALNTHYVERLGKPRYSFAVVVDYGDIVILGVELSCDGGAHFAAANNNDSHMVLPIQ